jgi:hypothetical protein
MPWTTLALGCLVLASEPAGGLRQLALRPGVTAEVPAATPERAMYPAEAAARSTQVFLLPPGPRTVTVLQVEPAPGTADAWRSARLRLSFETDDPDPSLASLDLPLGLAFGRVAGFEPVHSEATGDGRADRWSLRLPMPYRARALVRVDSDAPVAGRVRIESTAGTDPGAGYLRGAEFSLGPPGETADVRADGWAHLAGVLVLVDAPSAEAGLRLKVDDGAEESLAGPSGRPGPSAAGQMGPSLVSRWLTGRPIGFNQRLVLSLSGADGARGPGPTGRVAAFWYSERPGPARGPR